MLPQLFFQASLFFQNLESAQVGCRLTNYERRANHD